MPISEKPVIWLGSSLNDLRDFPEEARRAAGRSLGKVQLGVEPANWKPMPTVGLGVNEIRVRVGREFRVLYVAKLANAVYVLHAFEKKTRKTKWSDLELARRRYARIPSRITPEDGRNEDDENVR